MLVSMNWKPFVFCLPCLGTLLLSAACSPGAELKIDDRPGAPGEWGFHPEEKGLSPVNPPAFSWRPQKGAVSYELELAENDRFNPVRFRTAGIGFNVYTPPRILPPGRWCWRVRYTNQAGEVSPWSRIRRLELDAKARAFPLPDRKQLLARIPAGHPRLFMRPEQVSSLREKASGQGRQHLEALRKHCNALVKKPPPTAEPPTYPKGIVRGSDPWRKIWWGNRSYTIKVLDSAATLAFTGLITGEKNYSDTARRLLLDAAEWDPHGSTGYRYNDEAGMPYAYHFSRTYTFLHDQLSEDERVLCRRVMAARGKEMYRHLHPRHLWQPYSSHSNRAWHFLGEIGIAFYGEIPEAGDWAWFAANVQHAVYPVWSDTRGGWHEGHAYWTSYIGRFTQWVDVARAAFGIDLFQKPYFSQVGYYPMYLMPPGSRGGGFGDLNAGRRSSHSRDLMYLFAAAARNPYWQWYAEQHGPLPVQASYRDLLRGLLPAVPAKAPDDLPVSRCFDGVGQAMLNTTLLKAENNVAVLFKSSPFGTQSHGYDANNSFLLYAFGERLLIRSGKRDSYGSDHHKNWMWETKSVNSVTVNGNGQGKRTAKARGEITSFSTSKDIDIVAGEAGTAYGDALDGFSRQIVFVKPDLVVIYDRLTAPKPSTFTWHLHAPVPFKEAGDQAWTVTKGNAACRIDVLEPTDLDLAITDQFDVPPRPRVKLTEWHLNASAKTPASSQECITVIRPYRKGQSPIALPEMRKTEKGFELKAQTSVGQVKIELGEEVKARVM